MKKILDNIYNIGFEHGIKGCRCILTLSLLYNFQQSLIDFDGYDFIAEYEDGWQEGKLTRGLNLLRGKEGYNVSKV